MIVVIALLVSLAMVIPCMVICGDLRITKRQQREWQEQWDKLTPGERQWWNYLEHHVPGYGREHVREDFGP